MTFVPLAGALMILPARASSQTDPLGRGRRHGAALLIAIWLYGNFDTATTAFQFAENYPWIPPFNITYFIGVDGISISMVLLTALISFICGVRQLRHRKGA